MLRVNFSTKKVAFTALSANEFLLQKQLDSRSPLIKKFKPFFYMKLDNNQQYEVRKITMEDFNLSADTTGIDCSFNSTDPFGHIVESVTPTGVRNHTKVCLPQRMRAMYSSVLLESVKGMSDLYVEKVAELETLLTEKYIEMMAIEIDRVSSSGGLYNVGAPSDTNIDWSPTFTDPVKRTRYTNQINSAKGWVRKLMDDAATHPNYNVSGVFTAADIDNATGAVVATAQDLYDRAFSKCTMEMQQAIRFGEIYAEGEARKVQILVDIYTYDKIAKDYNAFRNLAAANDLFVKKIVEDGVTRYTLNDFPVVLDLNVNAHDKVVKNRTYLFAFTVAENIQIGSSFGSLKKGEDEQAYPVRFQAKEDLDEEGIVLMKQASLLSVFISEPRLITAAIFQKRIA